MNNFQEIDIKTQKGKINILYVSTLCSERLTTNMLINNLGTTNLAAQKFHRLVAQGMALNRDLFDINVLSVPVFKKSIDGKRIFCIGKEIEKGVAYRYIPIVLLPVINRFITAFYLCTNIISWRKESKCDKNIIVFDILNNGTSFVSIFVSKLFRIKTVAIVTDLPSLMYVLNDKVTLFNKFVIMFQNWILKITNGYVFLTEAMNEKLNIKGKPYCIIEGLSDFELLNRKDEKEASNDVKILHYSGGLYEKFGVKALIDAFMLIDNKDIRLHLFGTGDLVNYILRAIENDSRIVFFGYRENKVVLEDQLNSWILINPRFTFEDYTKYSFPSKTIEYMASGVPLLTTKLPGIPKEYFDFVFLFEEEGIDGYKKSMEKILNLPLCELKNFGDKARNFVLEHKNNKVQAFKFHTVFFNKLW
jgi:glycosyltransferase involved in cell wall biosynthesis